MPRFEIAAFLIIGLLFAGYGIVRTASNLLAPPTALPATATGATPCLRSDPESLEPRGLEPTRSFMFQGVTYGLRSGQAECTFTRDAGVFDRRKLTYCEFSHPVALLVTTPTGSHAYEPGPTNGATIFFVDGAPRCLSGSRLNKTAEIIRLHRLRRLRDAARAG